jgi:hypothetical protein
MAARWDARTVLITAHDDRSALGTFVLWCAGNNPDMFSAALNALPWLRRHWSVNTLAAAIMWHDQKAWGGFKYNHGELYAHATPKRGASLTEWERWVEGCSGDWVPVAYAHFTKLWRRDDATHAWDVRAMVRADLDGMASLLKPGDDLVDPKTGRFDASKVELETVDEKLEEVKAAAEALASAAKFEEMKAKLAVEKAKEAVQRDWENYTARKTRERDAESALWHAAMKAPRVNRDTPETTGDIVGSW